MGRLSSPSSSAATASSRWGKVAAGRDWASPLHTALCRGRISVRGGYTGGHLVRPVQGAGGGGAVRGAGGGHAHQGAAEPRHQEQEAGQQGHQPAQAEVSLETASVGQPSVNPP